MPKGTTKRLIFTKGRLSFDYVEYKHLHSLNALPDLKIRRLGGPCGGPIILALTFYSFLVKQKGIKTFHFTSPNPIILTQHHPTPSNKPRNIDSLPFHPVNNRFREKSPKLFFHKSSRQSAKPSSYPTAALRLGQAADYFN